MKRIFSTLYTVLISVLIASLVFAGGIPGTFGNMPPMAPQTGHGEVFRYDASKNGTLDFVSRARWTQTYAGTNRTRINSAGLLELVPANTPVIDHIGTSLEPALRAEGEGTNLLFNSNTFSAAGGYTLSNITTAQNAVGPSGTANEAWTVTDASAAAVGFISKNISKSTSDSTTYFRAQVLVPKKTSVDTYGALGIVFLITGTTKNNYYIINPILGTVTAYTSNNGANASATIIDLGLWYLVSVSATDNGGNSNVSFVYVPSWNEDGSANADNAAQGSNVIANASLTTGNIPSSYFAGAAAIGSELVTGTDSTFAGAGNWINSVGGPWGTFDINTTVAGKMYLLGNGGAGDWCILQNKFGGANKVYRISLKMRLNAGAATAIRAGNNLTVAGSYFEFTPTGTEGTYVGYIVTGSTDNHLYIGMTGTSLNGIAFEVDDVSAMEHGTVRLSESNTLKLAMPAAVAAALADTGTLVMDWMPGYARAAGVVTGILASSDATASLLYTTTAAGNLSSYDGTAVAASTAAYLANTWTKLALKWPSDTDKYKIGADVDGAGVAYGSEAAFDGAFTVGDNLIFGYALHGPMYMKKLRIFNKLISDAQVNAQ